MTDAPSSSRSRMIIELIIGPRSLSLSAVLTLLLSIPVFASDDWLKAHNMYTLSHPYHGFVLAIFWLCLCVTLVNFSRWFSLIIVLRIEQAMRRSRIKRYLINMPKDQMRIALEYSQTQRISLPWGLQSEAIRDLEQRGIVYQAGAVLSPRKTYPFALHEDAAKYFAPRAFQRILNARNTLEVKGGRKGSVPGV